MPFIRVPFLFLRVHCLSSITDEDGERPILIPNDLHWLEEVIRKLNTKLLILDPLLAFLTNIEKTPTFAR